MQLLPHICSYNPQVLCVYVRIYSEQSHVAQESIYETGSPPRHVPFHMNCFCFTDSLELFLNDVQPVVYFQSFQVLTSVEMLLSNITITVVSKPEKTFLLFDWSISIAQIAVIFKI